MRRHLLFCFAVGLIVTFGSVLPLSGLLPGVGAERARACSPARGALETVVPQDGRTVRPDTTFTVVYSGWVEESGGDAVEARLVTEQGEKIPLSVDRSASYGFGEYVQFSPETTLDPGTYELTVQLTGGRGSYHDAGRAPDAGSTADAGGTADMGGAQTHRYTVSSDATTSRPASPTNLQIATATRKQSETASCTGPDKTRVQFDLTESGETPAYALVEFEYDSGHIVYAAIDRESLESAPIEKTLNQGVQFNCAKVTTYDSFGAPADESVSTCDPQRCGEIEQSGSYHDWEGACGSKESKGCGCGATQNGPSGVGGFWVFVAVCAALRVRRRLLF